MKKYLDVDVYEAAMERIKYVFDNFEKVYLSFSGGKDSGLLLNLLVKYMRENNITRKLGIMLMDNEANYEDSLEFAQRIIDKNLDILDPYWCCLPITLPCTVSAYHTDWKCWGEDEKEKWIRPRPEMPYVITYENHSFPFFEENMQYDDFWEGFGRWYADGKTCACLVGIRADESLNRFRAVVNENKDTFDGLKWTTRKIDECYNCYPIYDWSTEDVWIANAKFEFDYNKLYDKFYMAGLTIAQMRVASPFMSEAKSSLNMYRVIDPAAWARLCCRVNGANFMATYGKQLDYKNVRLPEGHTWKSFTKFLLATLPEEARLNFRDRFIQSLKYWGRTGKGLPDKIVEELKELEIKHEINGYTAFGRKNKKRVVIKKFPDHVDELSCHNSEVASWKRFALTILRNDHTCKYLGLGPTQKQMERQKELIEKYKNL